MGVVYILLTRAPLGENRSNVKLSTILLNPLLPIPEPMQRLESLSEIAQFVAVRRGQVNKMAMEGALAFRELGRRLGQLKPRAPRFADAELLENPMEVLACLRATGRSLVEAYDDAVDAESGAPAAPGREGMAQAREAAEGIRAALITYLLSPLAGAQRGQVLARLQFAEADVEPGRQREKKHKKKKRRIAGPGGGCCNTCLHLNCPGNRLTVLEPAEGAQQQCRSVHFTISHHKNELAGRTQVRIVSYRIVSYRIVSYRIVSYRIGNS
jgi:hypothetical protein